MNTAACRLGHIVLTLALVCVQTSADGQTLLRYRFDLNETLRQTIVQELTSQVLMEGQTVRTALTQSIQQSQFVREVAEDGTASLQPMIDRVITTMKIPAPVNREFQYDTATRRNEQSLPGYSELIDALVRARLAIQISPTGVVSPLDIPESLFHRLQGTPAAALLGPLATPESVTHILSQPWIPLPDAPVQPGDRWQATNSLTLSYGRWEILQTYTYEGPTSEGLHRISVQHQPTLTPRESQYLTVQMLEATAEGTVLLDNNQGQVASLEIVQNLRLQLDVSGQSCTQQIRQVLRVQRE
jgi:hypothetical protein